MTTNAYQGFSVVGVAPSTPNPTCCSESKTLCPACASSVLGRSNVRNEKVDPNDLLLPPTMDFVPSGSEREDNSVVQNKEGYSLKEDLLIAPKL